MDLGQVGLEGADWMLLAQDRDVWRAAVITAMNLWIPKKAWDLSC